MTESLKNGLKEYVVPVNIIHDNNNNGKKDSTLSSISKSSTESIVVVLVLIGRTYSKPHVVIAYLSSPVQ